MMSGESYSSQLKSSLPGIEIKKKCCRYTYDKTNNYFVNRKGDLADCIDRLKCENCGGVFMRAVFIHCGTVNSPDKPYHLELSLPTEDDRDACRIFLERNGIAPKSSDRNGRYTLYYKSYENIVDFLSFIGAAKASFDYINEKLAREEKNRINRHINFEAVNMQKAITSSNRYVNAIKYIIDKGGNSLLSAELREAATLRVENNEATIAELGGMCSPPISKSGMRNRLDKILSIARDMGADV